MTEHELLRRHPKVWHMAADGTWPSIQQNGLLSVSKLLDLHGVSGADRLPIESSRRPQCVTLTHAVHGTAVIRDNKPLYEKSLLKCLQDGLTPKQWYETLNAKSFFWVDKARLDRLLGAQAYAKDPQVVLELDTKKLLNRHRADIRLSRINSGQTLYKAQLRGLETYKTIADFPDGPGTIGKPARPNIVELVVEGGVPDLSGLVNVVHRVDAGAWTQIWP